MVKGACYLPGTFGGVPVPGFSGNGKGRGEWLARVRLCTEGNMVGKDGMSVGRHEGGQGLLDLASVIWAGKVLANVNLGCLPKPFPSQPVYGG